MRVATRWLKAAATFIAHGYVNKSQQSEDGNDVIFIADIGLEWLCMRQTKGAWWTMRMEITMIPLSGGTQPCKVSKCLVISTMHFVNTSHLNTIRMSIQCINTSRTKISSIWRCLWPASSVTPDTPAQQMFWECSCVTYFWKFIQNLGKLITLLSNQ